MTTADSTDRGDVDRDIATAQQVFEEVTGVRNVRIEPRTSGLEVVYDVIVGRKALIYTRALGEIDHRLPEDSPLRSALLLSPTDRARGAASLEAQALGALIRTSLAVSRDQLRQDSIVVRVAFPGREETKVVEPTHHIIWGRRGVGKSSLILSAYQELERRRIPAAWVGAEAYATREDPLALVQILEDILAELEHAATDLKLSGVDALTKAKGIVSDLDSVGISLSQITRSVVSIKRAISEYHQDSNTYAYVFLDDAHCIGPSLQPFVIRTLRDIFHGAGGVVNVSAVRNLLHLHDPSKRVSVQIPDDFQAIPLDLTLEDPPKAKEHLEKVLMEFVRACGFRSISAIVRPAAVERLVWCSAGVPRDFLWLVERGIDYAVRHRRDKVGKEEVNLATGDLADQKLSRIEGEAPDQAKKLKDILRQLEAKVLDSERRNCFLVRWDPEQPGYANVQKLADLRLIHLLHSSITPWKAGDKHEAYLIDYSFYTGVRRRQRLKELKIQPAAKPKYTELRTLPRLALDLFE